MPTPALRQAASETRGVEGPSWLKGFHGSSPRKGVPLPEERTAFLSRGGAEIIAPTQKKRGLKYPTCGHSHSSSTQGWSGVRTEQFPENAASCKKTHRQKREVVHLNSPLMPQQRRCEVKPESCPLTPAEGTLQLAVPHRLKRFQGAGCRYSPARQLGPKVRQTRLFDAPGFIKQGHGADNNAVVLPTT